MAIGCMMCVSTHEPDPCDALVMGCCHLYVVEGDVGLALVHHLALHLAPQRVLAYNTHHTTQDTPSDMMYLRLKCDPNRDHPVVKRLPSLPSSLLLPVTYVSASPRTFEASVDRHVVWRGQVAVPPHHVP